MGVEAVVPVGARGAALAVGVLDVGVASAEAPDLEAPRHLQAVPARTPRWNQTRVLALAGAGLVLAVAFVLVYLHVVLAQRQFALDRLTTKVQAEQARYQNLRLQVAQLGSPAQIISTAEGKLGMRPPASVTYLAPSSTIGGTPNPAASQVLSGSAQAASGSPSSFSGQAPAGDADWPQIKAQLAGSP
jgi:cell division protein FtsL